jgi:hypothetical protein
VKSLWQRYGTCYAYAVPGALVYTRISDEEQGRRNAANIPTQTKKAKDHCDRLSLPVLKVFIDEESARTTDRPTTAVSTEARCHTSSWPI